jgi:hypothetical protein
LKSFLIWLATAFIIIAGTYVLLDRAVGFRLPPTYFWESLVFVCFTTSVLYYYLIRAGKNLFVQLYLLTLVIKLIAYAAYNIIVVVYDRPNAAANVAAFMLIYLILTTIELVLLYKKVDS